MAKIRLAEHADVEAVVELGAMLHAESPTYRPYTYSRQKARAVARSCIGSLLAPPADSVLFVADEGGEVIGMLGGYLTEGLFVDGMLIASDYTFFVRPDRRGTMAAPRLLIAFEQWAKGMGATHIYPSVSTRIDDERIVAFYAAMGYQHTGHNLAKRIG